MLANSVLRLIFRFPWGKRAGGKRAVSSGIGGIAWDCNDIDLLLLVSSLMILVLFRLFYHFPSSTSLSFRQQGQKSAHTQRAYRHDIEVFRDFVEKPLAAVTLEDALDFCDNLDKL